MISIIFFFQIENHLRESGLGDVSVNKKMKDLTKYFYDILLKLNDKNGEFLPKLRNTKKKYFFKMTRILKKSMIYKVILLVFIIFALILIQKI